MRLKAAAKRRGGLGTGPQAGHGVKPHRNPRNPNREAIPKKQESGSEAFLIPQPLHGTELRMLHMLHMLDVPRMPHMPYALKRMVSCRKSTLIR